MSLLARPSQQGDSISAHNADATAHGMSASGRAVLTGTPAQACAAIGAATINSPVPGLVLIGSSTFAYEGYNTMAGSIYIARARGPVSNGIALSGARCRIISNLAVSSSLIADHDAQFTAALALNPQCICIQSFRNDAFNGVTAATMKTYVDSWNAQATARGIHLIYRTSHWTPSFTAAQLREFLKIRSIVNNLAASNVFVHTIDAYGTFIDETSSTGANRANYVVEGLHPSNLGAYMDGKEYAKLFTQMFAPMPFPISDALDQNGSGVQYLRTPTLGVTGGTLGTHATGEVPQYWALEHFTLGSRSDGLNSSVSGQIYTDTDGRVAFRMSFSDCVAGDVFRLYQTNGSVLGPNGTYDCGMLVRIDSGTIAAQPEFVSSGGRTLCRDSVFYPIPETGVTYTLRIVVKNVTNPYGSAYLYLPFGGSGSAVITVKSAYMRYVGT